MNEQTSKKREWVKNAAIIFLAAMLSLTFFSNTIMNYSLPQVAAQYASAGTISEQIRGSGTLAATQEYEVKISETRAIKSVSVKAGDTVAAGDVIMNLEDKESKELTDAEKALDDLELAYQKLLLASVPDYSSDNLDIENAKKDVEKAKEDLANVGSNEGKVEAAKEAVKTAQKAVDAYKEQLKDIETEIANINSVKAATASGDTTDYSELSDEYYKEVSSIQDKIVKAEEKKTEYEKSLTKLETKMEGGTTTESLNSLRKTIEGYELDLSELYFQLAEQTDSTKIITISNQISAKELDIKYAKEDLEAALGKTSNSYSTEYYAAKYKYDQANSIYKAAVKGLDTFKKKIKDTYKAEQDSVNEKLTEANYTLTDATTALTEITGTDKLTEATAKDKVDEKQRALEALLVKYGLTSETAQLDIDAKKNEISKAQDVVDKLKEKTTDAKVTAKMGGVIKSISVVAGESAAADAVLAVIEVNEKGYQLSFSVTNEQAKKVKVGDAGEIPYYWDSEIKAVISSIKVDTANPTSKKTLTFDVSGDVATGQSLNIQIGASGQNYDVIVPKSAVRKDSDGQFVLVVTSKSSPLGNRYYAERVPVEVLASDDVQSAVSGLYGNEFVITTSNKLVEAGMQVRMEDKS